MPKQLAVIAAVLLGASLLAGRAARAQERDPAAAQALFDEARTLMNDKRYAEACAKLAESMRLDPGIGTQFNLATCREHEGKVASAWAAFHEVASLATATGQTARAEAANRRASLLEPRLPRLRIVVPAAARAAGLEITRDGVVVGEAQWGLALPLDPGEHQLEVTAPGRRAFAGAVNVAEGATVSFQVPPLEVADGQAATEPAEEPAKAAAPPRPARASEPAATEPPSSDESSGPSALVVTLGVVGIAGIAGGSVLGLVAGTKNDDSKSHCLPDDPNRCNATGVALRDDAFLFGNLATAGFIVGGAALAAAAVLWITDGPDAPEERAALELRASPAGLALEGSF
jgi:hypothetical protein